MMKIRIEDITKHYCISKGERLAVLEDINLEIEDGDFVIILGESGCGKSTLLNIIGGLTSPSSGAVWIDEDRVLGPHRSISMHFQQPSLLPWLDVEDNIAFGCRVRGELENLEYRVNEYIEMMGLSGFEKRHPAELSVGMACRVSLARALVGYPEVFLLDEPFGSLDTFTRARLQEELINIWLSENFTTVFVTHDISEAVLMGNKIVLLGGQPCRIMDTIAIDLSYPRRMTDESSFLCKKMILEKFRNTFGMNKALG
jgi:NitT/TauT family transport system ATP-binding protein/sulfonate transport system ATP-binding protein